MKQKNINALFFSEILILIFSIVLLWILNNHFLTSLKSNQLALLAISLFNVVILVWIGYLSLKQKLILQTVLLFVLASLVVLGTVYLYVTLIVGDAIFQALRNANFTF